MSFCIRESKVLRYRYPTTNDRGQLTANASEHERAIYGPPSKWHPLLSLVVAWERYADEHETRYDSPIGQDSILGPYWAETGLAIKRLFDGETGGIDAGSVANNIADMITAQGIANNGYELV